MASPPRPTSLQVKRVDSNTKCVSGNDKIDDSNEEAAKKVQPEAKKKRRRKKMPMVYRKFSEHYKPTGEQLGSGASASVSCYKNVLTGNEVAVKVIEKTPYLDRMKVLKEIDSHYHCKGHDHIVDMLEYFEETDRFYLIFEKMEGGSLLDAIEKRLQFKEHEAKEIIKELASAIDYMHKKGLAHRDLKLENILCQFKNQLIPVKICDLDLGSGKKMGGSTPELLTPVGSAEYMAPEVVDVWTDEGWSYTKKCDLWSLGIIMYILLCGYAPFVGHCGEDCGWNEGMNCSICQDQLFEHIRLGVYQFPAREWSGISEGAKDLIANLLVRDPDRRFSAEQVLQHAWICESDPEAQQQVLSTPRVLSRTNSLRELEALSGHASVLNRMVETSLAGLTLSNNNDDDDHSTPLQVLIPHSAGRTTDAAHFTFEPPTLPSKSPSLPSLGRKLNIHQPRPSLNAPTQLRSPNSSLAERRKRTHSVLVEREEPSTSGSDEDPGIVITCTPASK